MSIREVVRGLKEKEESDPLSRASCDFMRALVILHGSGWDSEVSDTMAALWNLRGDQSSDISQYHKALKKIIQSLNSQDIVQSAKKKRSVLSSRNPVDEVLHTVEDMNILHQFFSGDRWVEKFRREIMGDSGFRME